MIINIPLSINEEDMKNVIEKDYEDKVIKEIALYIKRALVSSSSSYYGDRETDGMITIIKRQVDILLEQNKDKILNIAGNYLADKLLKTKAGKELLQEVKNDII